MTVTRSPMFPHLSGRAVRPGTATQAALPNEICGRAHAAAVAASASAAAQAERGAARCRRHC